MALLIGDPFGPPFGDQTLVGVDNEPNTIYGDTDGQMSGGVNTGGDDTIIGGANSNNLLVGDADSMISGVTGGADTLIGGVGGSNTLIGDAVSTTGLGPNGGADRLVSAANTTDNMWGDFQDTGVMDPDGGADTFVFGPNNGNDLINDFEQGLDIIEFNSTIFPKELPPQAAGHVPANAGKPTPGFPETFSDLNIDDSSGSTVITLDADNSVTVAGVTGLVADDFMFT